MSTGNHENGTDPAAPVNPFAAPLVSANIEPLPSNPGQLPPPKLPNVIGKWLLVCAFAAAPSFFFGGSLGGWRFPAVLGMVIGVLVFVAGYAALEFTAVIQQQMTDPVSRRAAWIAYSTRVGISIVFPIGVFVDVFCGAFVVAVSSALTGIRADSGYGFRSQSDVPALIECLQFMFTTVAQGVLLNVVLFGYMGIAWVFCKMLSQR